MSEQNPKPPATPSQGAQKQPKNQPNPDKSTITDAARMKSSAADTSPKKYGASAGAAAVGLGGVPKAIDAGKSMSAERAATKPSNKATTGTEDPALAQKKAGRRGAEPSTAPTPEKPPKPSKMDSKTAKGIGKAGQAIGGGDLLKKSQSDGSIKGDGEDIAKGVQTGAKLGTKVGGPVGTAVGAVAGGVLQGLKTKRGRHVIVFAIFAPSITVILFIAIIFSMITAAVDSATRPTNDRIASSVNTVVAEGVPEWEVDQYASIATSVGIQWQVLPAIAYQRENAGIGLSGSATGSVVGPMGVDMNQVKELEDGGYPAISRKDAEDRFTSAAYLAPLFTEYLYEANQNMDSVSLEAGSEYAESPGNGSIRQEGTSGADQIDSADIEQAYTTALSKLPLENAASNAPQIYSIARSWALGNQACVTNALNGFVNDGLWSNPIIGPSSNNFGTMRNVGSVPHEGEDLSAPNGTPIYAAGSGQVTHAGPGGTEGGWAGNWVEITHAGGVKTIYAHMSTVIATEGQAISAGQPVGKVGNTGNSWGAHLHFQIHINNKREVTNPTAFLASHGVDLGVDKPLTPGAVAGSGDTVEGDVNSDATDTSANVALPQSFTGEQLTGQKVTLNQFQVNHAAAIVSVGSQQGISDKGLAIAVQVALQESTLRNLSNVTNVPESNNYPSDGDGSDHDSVGLFQQRAGWGSVKERMTPSYSAKAFFGGPKGPNNGSPRGLLDISGWEAMPNGQAAQTVQVSAFPDAYDKWEPVAVKLVAAVKGNNPMGGTNCAGGEDEVSTAGIVAPSEAAKIAIANARAQLGVPYSWGGGNKDGKSRGIDQGANTVGFDCSGLTVYAYGKAGIVLPRLSDDQINVGIKITKADLSPGDLVFWTGHLAMYLGGGKVIHAPRTGKFVEIVPLAYAYAGEPTGYSRPAGGASA